MQTLPKRPARATKIPEEPYFKNVLDRLLAGDTDYNALRPDVWKQSHHEAIRTYRVEERLARADAKMTKRAKRRAAAKR